MQGEILPPGDGERGESFRSSSRKRVDKVAPGLGRVFWCLLVLKLEFQLLCVGV